MKLLILLCMALALVAEDSPKRQPKTPSKQAGLTVPPDAVKTGPYSWRYVDKDGKAWIYRYTITGLVRFPDSGAEEKYAGVKVTDKGDSYRFEKPAVMGVSVWDRKKTELTDEEKAMVEYVQAKSALATATAVKDPEKK